MESVPEELARWAVRDGLAIIAAATQWLAAGEDALSVGTRLRRDLAPDRAAFAGAAAATRLRAVAAGVPHADRLVLTREAMEQASRPSAAAWRARRAAEAAAGTDERLQDRCAGTGGDAVALAAHRAVLAVERDPGRAVLAAHRAQVAGVEVEVRCADAVDGTVPSTGAVVHADPDRRDRQGRRARRLADHIPSPDRLLAATADAHGHLLTVAPGVAWDDRGLPDDAEVVFLQEGTDLLEAVLCLGAARQPGIRATAVLLDAAGGALVRSRSDEDRPELPVSDVRAVLATPAPALVRARLHDEVGDEVGATRLATRSSLLTLDDLPDVAWLDAEPVEAVLPARPAAVRDHLRMHSDRRVEVLLHGVQTDVATWLRAAGDPPTGPDDLRIHLVRRDDDAIAVLSHVP